MYYLLNKQEKTVIAFNRLGQAADFAALCLSFSMDTAQDGRQIKELFNNPSFKRVYELLSVSQSFDYLQNLPESERGEWLQLFKEATDKHYNKAKK